MTVQNSKRKQHSKGTIDEDFSRPNNVKNIGSPTSP
jgi:hypothetical protein